MLDSRESGKISENNALFDYADVRDASTFESQRGKTGAGSIWSIVGRVIRRKRFMLAVALFAMVVTLYMLNKYGYISPETVIGILKSHPILAPIIFTALYALMVVCLVPTLPLNLGAGLIWGPYWGGFLTMIGAGTGSAIAFLAARYIASEYLNEKFSHSAWIWLKQEIQQKEWKAVAFTRINPIFPFGPSSYFFGLTQIKFGRYFITTLLSILPLSIIFAAIGSSVGGIVLEGDAYGLVRDILAVSLAATLLLVLKAAIMRITK